MPAKSRSPEAAQHKLWRHELKQTTSLRRKVVKDFDTEQRRLRNVSLDANKKLTGFIARRAKQEPRALKKFDSRIAVLRGRLGL